MSNSVTDVCNTIHYYTDEHICACNANRATIITQYTTTVITYTVSVQYQLGSAYNMKGLDRIKNPQQGDKALSYKKKCSIFKLLHSFDSLTAPHSQLRSYHPPSTVDSQ